MVSESIEWAEKEKKIYNVNTNEVESLKLLWLNQIDKYNNGMGDADVVDLLKDVYRMDRWVRNRRWWWSMFFCSIGTLLTNAYKLYLRICEEEGKPPKEYKEQNEFRSAIAEYYICSNCVNTAAKESSTTMTSRIQSTFEFSSPSSSTISTVANPLASLDGTDKASRITDVTLELNGMFHCSVDQCIGHCPAVPHKNRR